MSLRQTRTLSPVITLGITGLLLVLALPALAAEITVAPKGTRATGAVSSLSAALESATDNTVIRLLPGEHELTPQRYLEPTCGNCAAESTRVEATVGVTVRGRGIRIEGDRGQESIIMLVSRGLSFLRNNIM